MADIYETRDHQVSDMESQYAGEVTRITTADVQRGVVKQELMDVIHQEISPLSMQSKRKVLLSIRKIIMLSGS